MNRSLLLKLQLGYALAAITFNIMSYLSIQMKGQPFTTTEPMLGIFAMLLYTATLGWALIGKDHLYRLSMLCALFIFSYNGITIHLANYSNDPTQYSSFTAFFIAILINVFGSTLNAYSVFSKKRPNH